MVPIFLNLELVLIHLVGGCIFSVTESRSFLRNSEYLNASRGLLAISDS